MMFSTTSPIAQSGLGKGLRTQAGLSVWGWLISLDLSAVAHHSCSGPTTHAFQDILGYFVYSNLYGAFDPLLFSLFPLGFHHT